MFRKFFMAFSIFFAITSFAQTYFVEIPTSGPDTMRFLNSAKFDVAGIDRMRGMIGVVASPDDLERLSALGLRYDVIDSSHPLRDSRGEALSDYKDPQEIMAFVDKTVGDHPALARKIILEDQLFEGQQQVAVLITSNVSEPNSKRSFILDAQHHAREVMGPEIALDMIDYLTDKYGSDPKVKQWVDEINIYVVPSVNPDGGKYVFTTDNMWRKNRNPACGSGLKTGIDLNRNYRFNWDGCLGSDGYCGSLVYRGTAPDSEPETRGLESLMDEARALFALTLHAYGEYIIYPYGCTWSGQVADDQDLMQAVGEKIVAVLENDDGAVNSFLLGSSDGTDGMAQDTYYGNYGTYAYLIEVGRSFQPDYASLRDKTVARLRMAWQTLLEETLAAPQITGVVTDSTTGRPIPAAVSLEELPLSNGETPRSANAMGRYNILARKNTTYHATFSLPGYCSTEREVVVEEGPVTVDATLDPSADGSPSSPQPSNGSMNVPLSALLSWSWNGTGSTDVYFGTQPDPPKAATVTGDSWTTPALESGKTYYWRLSKNSPCGVSSGPIWSFSTIPYGISSVSRKGDPFRLVIEGTGFVQGCTVKIDGTAAPKTSFKSDDRLVAKGGSSLKAMVPKGHRVTITVEDEAGGSSNGFEFGW